MGKKPGQSKEQNKPLKHFVEKLSKQGQEATRNNIASVQQTIHKPVVSALLNNPPQIRDPI